LTSIVSNLSLKYIKQKSFTIWEELGKPRILSAVKEVLVPPAILKLERLPFSNDTIQRRIEGKATAVDEYVIEELKKLRYFASHLNESTDVTNCATLLCFLHYMRKQYFKEELLFCMKLPGRTPGSKILEYFSDKERQGKLFRCVHKCGCKIEYLSSWCSCKN